MSEGLLLGEKGAIVRKGGRSVLLLLGHEKNINRICKSFPGRRPSLSILWHFLISPKPLTPNAYFLSRGFSLSSPREHQPLQLVLGL